MKFHVDVFDDFMMAMMMIEFTSQQLQSTGAWSAALCSKPHCCTSHLPEYDHYADDHYDVHDDDLHDDDDDDDY